MGRTIVQALSPSAATAPQVQLLVTSRERLPLREEQAYPIIGLECADEEFDDTRRFMRLRRLFCQAATRTEPSFEIATNDVVSLSQVCRLLEGMPLAIELAATWADVLSLGDIAAEIQRGLDFLATEWQDAPERHRSVRAAIDASWRRLTERSKPSLPNSACSAVVSRARRRERLPRADLRTLARLADKSLLSFSRERRRYDTHELLRQYGSDRLPPTRSWKAPPATATARTSAMPWVAGATLIISASVWK